MSEHLIEAQNIGRSFGNENIFHGVSLSIAPGTTTTIVGPSGSGKTTLLGILALLMKPSAGTLLVQGKDAAQLSDRDRSRMRNEFYGCIFQSAHLIGSLSVLDNVLVPASLSDRTHQKRKAAREFLEKLGLAERLHHLPHMLSLGQKRRVAIARALVMKPPVILADEPTNDLDEHRATEIADFLLKLPSDGYSLLLVTHDQDLATRAGNCWSIKDRRLIRIR